MATSTSTTITYNSTNDAILHLFTGGCSGTMTALACSDSGSSGNETITYATTIGTRYRVRIQQYDSDVTMNGTICVYESPKTVPSSGNNSFTMCSGNLYDNGGSSGNYAVSSNGYTVLNPSVPGNFVRVSGSITAEAGYDYLTIYDGTGTGGTILWGGAPHGTGTTCTTFTVPTITSTTGPLTVRFYSDGSRQCAGFNLTVSCVAPVPPTITSFTPSNACASSSQTVVITGTNFTGATAVTIGGTAAAAFVVNSATQITATIGAGTTGTIQVTTPGGTATSAATFTVNPLPANPGNPTSNSPQCNPPGVTLTRTGTPLAGVTWYWQTTAGGTSIANSAATFVATTGGTYYLRARNITTGCWSAGSGSVAVTITPTLSTAAATPNPTNTATGVCYAGAGAVTSISWGAVAGATSYDVYFGAGSVPATVTANVTTNSYPFGTLTPNTTYYWRIVAKNACGDAPTSATFRFTTSTEPVCYCTPTTSLNLEHITGVASEGTINDVSNTSGYSPGGYANYSSIIIATQIPGGGININLSLTDITTFERQFVRTWVDWNNDGDFDDTGELVYTTGTTATGTTSYGFLVPAAQALGNYRMRIKTRNISDGSTYNSCSSYNRGETEDYTIRVIADCPAKITGITPGSACGPTNTVTLSATMSAGSTQIRWYDALTGGTLVGTGASFTTPVLSSSTTYYVTASNASCETIHRTPVKATILSTTDITITPSVPEVCGKDNVVSISALGDNITEIIHTQDFESGLSGYIITTTGDTTPTSGLAPDAPWSIKTSPYQTTTNVWKPAINSGPVGTVGNRFAFTTSDYSGTDFTTTITSPAINVSTYTSLTLTFDHFFSRYVDDLGTIQASIDNGATWSTVNTFTAKDGSASKFKSVLIDLSFYAGNTQLQIQFQYYGSYDDGWAIDNIKLEGVRPLNTLFTWTGATIAAFADVACTVAYTNQPVTTVYVKPTPSQLAMPSWSFTANATLGNGCIISTPVTITNKTKLWKGTSDNNWYNPNNWEPTGIPDANTCVYVYDGPFDSNINNSANDAYAKFVTVRPAGELAIQTHNDLIVTDAVTVDAGGTFTIEDSGSLIQINDVANLGNINYKRIAPGIRGLDYVYWSSPVANQNLSTLYSSPVSGPKYVWNTTVANSNNSFGNWENASGIMQTAKGYIIRGSSSYGMAATNIAASFTGVPHNGSLPFTIARGTYTEANYNGTNGIEITKLNDNFNLIGNPYPSAIDAKDFLLFNTYHAINNPTGQIYGNVRLWRHGSAPAAIINPFYGSFTYNYTADDYVTVNILGASDPISTSEIIKTGQAFFVLMVDGPASTGVVTFNNAMRLKSGAPHDNGSFFRTPSSITETDSPSETAEKHRIWLDLIDQNNSASGTLIGYATGALDGFDTFNDARSSVPNFMKIYSLLDNDVYDIQGKSVPFNQQDQVPLGITTVQAGTYKIGLNTIDGLFLESTQNIYLEDKTTQVIHNLKTSPYSFTSALGTFHDRFVLRYTNETLGTNDLLLDEASVWVFSAHHLTVKSSKNEIQSVRVFDLLGRALAHYPNANSMEVPLTTIQQTDSGLIIQVTLSNGTVVTKKTIY